MGESYNAAVDLIESNLSAGRGNRIAYIDDHGRYTYADLAERVNRFANVVRKVGLAHEQRVLVCMCDGINLPVAFLGSIKAGVVPILVNTLLTQSDYAYMLRDSRASALVVSSSLWSTWQAALKEVQLAIPVIVDGPDTAGCARLETLMAAVPTHADAASTHRDGFCFWLYSSGSTGTPKGTVHVHGSLRQTAELYARGVLKMTESDVVFSAAKLPFAYGLGNGLTFPLSVGGTAVLMAERPTAAAVCNRIRSTDPTIFFGVPTLYATLLASAELGELRPSRLRLCVSAGEALPAEIGRRWSSRFGVDIVDGIGSTEMLHIFLSNRPGTVKYGTTGLPVEGYEVRLVDEHAAPVPNGQLGELQVRGPSAAALYWNNREKTSSTFLGPWVRSGDQYFVDEEGYYVHAGRIDDMLKVGGLYVSPIEVESALLMHKAVLEVAVVGAQDGENLTKPMAFVVLAEGFSESPQLSEDLKQFVKSRLAPYKYPRWVRFIDQLPKTPTGKIQRFRLRAELTAEAKSQATPT